MEEMEQSDLQDFLEFLERTVDTVLMDSPESREKMVLLASKATRVPLDTMDKLD